MKPKRKSKKEENVLDISQYALTGATDCVHENRHEPKKAMESHSDVASVAASGRQNTAETKEGKEILDRLIMQDIVDKPIQSHPTAISQRVETENKNLEPTGRKYHTSKHIVDLRKHYLIEKYNLHTIDQPRLPLMKRFVTSFSGHRERIKWHFPERIRIKIAPKKHPADDEPIEESIEYAAGAHTSIPAFATFAIILIVLLLPVPGVKILSNLLTTKQQLWLTSLAAFSNLKAGVAGISENHYQAAQQSLENAANDFDSIANELNSYTTALQAVAPVLPSVNAKIVLARETARIGKNSAEIAFILTQGLTTVKEQNTPSDTLLRLSFRFNDIADSLDQLQGVLDHIKDDDVPSSLIDSLQHIKQNRALLADGSRRVASLSEVIYHIMGGDTYSRYLLLFQNNRELRPTGGFIGSLALADFSRGTLNGLEFPGGGAYDLAGTSNQNLIPPEPISILNEKWFIWDANWWPDFPTSARKIANMYDDARGTTLNGVIAVNATVMQQLLAITGPIEMPQYGVTVSDTNFFDVIQTYVEQKYDTTENQPKKILKDMMPIVIERLRTSVNYRDLFLILASSLRTRDLQISIFDDADIASRVRTLGWDGSLKTNDKDFLSVVTTNIAGGKSDQSIYDTITHEAKIQDNGDVIVTTRIAREHRATPTDALAYVNHVDYLRFYVPLGSTLVDASGFVKPDVHYFKRPSATQIEDPDLQPINGEQTIDLRTGVTIGAESNHTVFAHWLQVQPGQRVEASISYKLPFRVNFTSNNGVDWFSDWYNAKPDLQTYSFLAQKQSGKHNVILNSSITLPDTYRIVWSGDTETSESATTPVSFSYSSELDADAYYALLIGQAPKDGTH